MENLKKETVDMLLETYHDGIVKGLEIAEESLVEFIRIKEAEHKLAPMASITEISLFMETTIDLYKEGFKKQ